MVLVPNKKGNHVELYCYAYITASLEHLIRFLDHIQSLLDEQILTEEFEGLGLGLGLEDPTEPTTALERLETIVAKKVEEALALWLNTNEKTGYHPQVYYC